MGGAIVQRELGVGSSGRNRVVSGKGLVEPIILEQARDQLKAIKERMILIVNEPAMGKLENAIIHLSKILEIISSEEIQEPKNYEKIRTTIKNISNFIASESPVRDEKSVQEIEGEIEVLGYSLWTNRIIREINRLENILASTTVEDKPAIEQGMALAKKIEKIASIQRSFFFR